MNILPISKFLVRSVKKNLCLILCKSNPLYVNQIGLVIVEGNKMNSFIQMPLIPPAPLPSGNKIYLFLVKGVPEYCNISALVKLTGP